MRKAVIVLPVLYIALYFFHFAGSGLRADFSQDDLMNMWRGMERSYPAHLTDIFAFWRPTPVFRPFGSLVYKVSLDLFGLNLFPLRLFCYLVICLNLFLVYALTHRLTKSRETGALAALLLAYHNNFSSLYFNNGTLYDILCFFFTLAAMLLYVQVRQADRRLNWWLLASFSLLLVLALDSKEMALAVPIFIGVYELIYHPPSSLTPRQALSWLRATAPAPVIAAIIAAVYYFGRISGPEGIASSGAYKPAITLAEYLKQTGGYLDELFYRTNWFTAPRTAAFLLILLAAAWLIRSKALRFSALFFATGILPIAFIPPRSLNAAYIPVAGLAIYCAALLVQSRDYVLQRLGHRTTEGEARYGLTRANVFLFAVVAYCLLRVQPDLGSQYNAWQKEYGVIRSVMNQLPKLHPKMPKEGRILMVKDPFGEFNWASKFITCLVYRDPYLRVDRLPSMEKRPDAAEIATYDFRLAYEDGRLQDVSAAEVPVAR